MNIFEWGILNHKGWRGEKELNVDTLTTEVHALAVSDSQSNPIPNINSGRGEVFKHPSNKDNPWCIQCQKTKAYKGDVLKVTREP